MTNIYSKLQNARVQLQNMNLKKTGNNKFAGYTYFELGDFLPKINEIFQELKLFSQITFTNEVATLHIVNSEKPDEIISFTSPMESASLKGTHPIQNLGAVETYQRRYLYMMALEIVEGDPLDATLGKEQKSSNNSQNDTKTTQNPSNPPKKASDSQMKLLNNYLDKVAEKLKLTKQQLIEKYGIKSIENISVGNASKMIDSLKKQVESEN